MFQRVRIPHVAKCFLAFWATALLIASPAVADDMGGESVAVPPPVMEPAPEPMLAEPISDDDTRWTPIQVSIVPPVQIFQDPDREVRGLRLNLPYGEWSSVTGLDLGVANFLNGDLRGVQIGFANIIEGSGYGAQIGIVNWSFTDFTGLQTGVVNVIEGTGRAAQLGLVNESGTHTGLQIGFANIAQRLKGVQIGFVNINQSGEPVPFLPIINVGF